MNLTYPGALPLASVSTAAADAVRGVGELAVLPAADRAALLDLGLIDVDAALTPAGRRLREDLRGAVTVLLRSIEPDGTTRRGRLYVGTRQMMYLGIPSAAPPASGELLVLPSDAVPVLLAGWGRLQPLEQAVADLLGPVDAAALRRRCASPAEPEPATVDPVLAAMWRAPWRSWTVQCDQLAIELSYVDIVGYGTYRVRPAIARTNPGNSTYCAGAGRASGGTDDLDELVELAGRPSSLLWGDLQGVLRPLRGEVAEDW